MALLIKTKTKKEEKVVKDFLNTLDIDFQTYVAEDAVPYTTRSRFKKVLNSTEKQILDDLGQSVNFVNKYIKGKIKTKSFNQVLNEL
ncbi:MAG: hypothetical protein JWM28_598 [Chitinophagaceae bacterium]|nr:hypothetical protein [Chitinophagaceae bacterium]